MQPIRLTMITPLYSQYRKIASLSHCALTSAVAVFGLFGSGIRAQEFDWGVSQSGLPGVYSWQHLFNWNANALHQSPLSVPSSAGDIANLNLLNLLGNQTINLNDTVTLGTLNIGDLSGLRSYTVAAGAGGILTFNNGGTALLNKSGLGTDVISAPTVLNNPTTISVQDGNLILGGVVSGANGITKTGGGTLWLRNTAANTYTGTTYINEGIVISAPLANTGQALGATGATNHTVIADGATLAIGQANFGQSGITTAETITVSGRGFRNLGAIRAFNNGAQTATISGVITMTDLTRFHAGAGGELTISSAFDVNQTVEITGQRLVNFTGAVSGSGTINSYSIGGLRMLNTSAGQAYSGTINSFNGEVRSDPDVAAPVNASYGSIAALNLRNSWLRLAVRTGAGTTANNGLFSTTAPISMGASRIYIDNRGYTSGASQITYGFSQEFGITTLVSGHNQIGFRAALTTGSLTMNFADIAIADASTSFQLFVDNAETGHYLGQSAKNRILNQALETAGVNVPFLGGNVYSNAEWVKYLTVDNGGHGYTPLVAADYKLNQAVGTWTAADHIKFDNGNFTITADTEIRSLNIQGATARTLGGNPGTTLTIGSGGILTSGTTHVISVPILTAGSDSNYHIYDIAWATNRINSVITDNGANAVSLVKLGTGTTSFFGANTYTGTTYINEGMFRDVIGSFRVALGSGNLHLAGSSNTQATYETDLDFTRSLGSGVGQVQLTGGGSVGSGSVGFSAYGRSIAVNLGGAGDPVVWGSTFFDPGVFTLNGGNSTHALTFINPLDLGGEPRYVRLDGNANGGGRGTIGRFGGDVFNGGVVKRGGGTLLVDRTYTYESGTVVEQGLVWLREGGSLGADVIGNDIDIRSDGALHIDSPDLVGDRQMIYLQNRDNTTPVAIGFGSGYGDGSGVVFNSFKANGGIPRGGGNNIFITDSANGARRIAIQMNGMNPTSIDFSGVIKDLTAVNTEVWFGATTANGVFTGNILTPTGAVSAWRLGSGGGTLTIQNANVLDGAATLIVGAVDNTARANIGGVVYLPQAQNFTGTISHNSVVGGTLIGSGGLLVVGGDASLNSANQTILLRSGELRLSVAAGSYLAVDSQYADRNIDVSGGSGILRLESLGGSGQTLVELNTLRLDGADRVLTIASSTTRQDGVLFLDTTTLSHTAATNQFLDIGFDNQAFNSGFVFLQGQVLQTGTGNKTLIKRQGGTLVLMADNSHSATQVQQGNLVLTHAGAAGLAGSTISMNTNSDRNSRLYFMMDSGGVHTFDNTLTFQGGNNGSVRWVGVGSRTAAIANLDAEIRINTMNMSVATSVNNGNIIFDGAHGHRLSVIGNTVMGRDTRFRVRGTVLTLGGTVSGAFALNKAEFGTLVLNGNNTYTGVTTVEQGTVVAGHANAFGNASSDVIFSSGSSSQILVSGVTNITRNFVNSATANVQILGGLDAGVKTLSGNLALTGRGLHLVAQSGGNVTFTGVISGAGATGITKIGPGTVILNPGTGTGNTYSGGTVISSGILAGVAQATSGSPFGTGAIEISNGALALQGIGATTDTATTGALTISGGANLAIWDQVGDANATTMTFGSLTRTNNGTLTLVPYTGSLATHERLVFTAPPSLVNGIIGPWMVAADSFAVNAGNYVTYAGGQVTTAGAYGGSGDLDGIAAGDVWDAGVNGGNLTDDRSGFAFRTNANVDLAGNVLTLGDAGLAGIIFNNGAGISGAAGSRIDLGTNQLSVYVDSANSSTLDVAVTNFRANTNNTVTDVGFIKFGQGNLIVNAGALSGLQNSLVVAEGTLTAGAANIFPMFENLNVRTGGILTIHPNATVNFNSFDQEIGNLAGIAPSNNINTRFFDTGGTLDLGGATLTVGREGSSQVFGGQLIGGVGSKLVKVGSGDLSFTNINPDRINSLETLQIDLGSVTTRADDNSIGNAGGVAFSLPSTTEVILRGGRWNLRTTADGTGNQQTILVGNNVTAYGGNSTLSVDRPELSGSNKLLILGNLTIDLNNFLVTAGNTHIPRFDGTTTFTHHARIQTDTQLVLRGAITDGGNSFTLNKVGSSDLGIYADNSATWSGGLVVRQGLVYFGSRGEDEIMAPGTGFISGNVNANAGTGTIVINQGFTTTTALRLFAPSNILTSQGQTVQIFGSERSGQVRIDVGTDAALTAYGLRSTTNGSLSLGLGDGGFYTTALDQSMMGNGKWGISAFQTTYYTPDTLGAGVDNIYRFSGTTGILGLTATNILTGSARVEIGRSPLHVGNVPTSSPAYLRTYGDQDFTGATVIHRGADTGSIGGIWEFHGDLATPTIENYGRLEARGDGRFVDDAGNMVNQVILRPGSVLRLNYNMDVNDQFIVSRQDNSNLGIDERKWGDDEAIFLDGAQLQITSGSGRVNQETVGQITVAGGAGIFLERVGTSGQPILITNQGIVRQGQASLTIRNTTVAEFGSIELQSQKFYINDAAWVAANRINGMLRPWMINLSNLSFLDYDPASETGMTNAAWTQSGTGAAFLAGLNATDLAHYTAGSATLTANTNVYALRVTGATTLDGHQINVHSGGLLTNEAVTINSNLYFGDGDTPVEGITSVANNTLTLGGVVTAANLTKSGPSTLTLTNASNAISGNIQLNGGTLIGNLPGAFGTASITLHADYLNNNNGSQMPVVSFRTASVSGTYENAVIVAGNVPLVRLDFNRSSGSSSGTITLSSLAVVGTDGSAGTLVQFEHNNSYNSAISGTVTLGGTSDIGIRVNAGTTTWDGAVTAGMGSLIKSGDGTLTFTNLGNDLDTGLILNRGIVVTRANTSGQSFQGNLELNFGQLTMGNTTGTAGVVFAEAGQTVTVNGQMILRTQRFGSTTAHMTIGAEGNGNQFITNNSPWLIFQANSGGDRVEFRSDFVINDAPWFRSDSQTIFRTLGTSITEGEGKINKAGIGYFAFENTAANTYAGGTDIWAGEFMVRSVGATMGTGAVRLFAGGALAVRNVANLGTTGLTQVVTSGGANTVLAVRNNDGGNAQFDAILAAYASADFRGNGVGILGLGGGRNYSADLDMANRNGGLFANWWIGGVEGAGTISANSLSPWGPDGNAFLLGGGQNGTLTVNPATAGSDQLAGAGNRLIIGGGLNHMGWGTVTFGANADNSFGGGTLVQLSRELVGTNFRGTSFNIQGGANGAAWRTPLGSGIVNVHGDVRIEGGSGTAANSATTNANIWVFHPGSRIRFDNDTPFGGTGGGGRWGDDVGMTLNTSVLEMYGDATTVASNSETIGDLTIAGGSEVVVRRRGAFLAELIAGDLTRSGSGTLMVTGMDTNTNTVTGLGSGAATSAMRFKVTNGASLMDNNMVAPWIIDRIGGQFMKYTVDGFAPITLGGAPDNYVTTSVATLDGTAIGINDGTRIVNLESAANYTLGDNLDIYALRLNRDINVSEDGQFQNIIIRSGGLTQFANTPTINANLFFGEDGDGTGEALIHASNSTLQINGKIHASQVTKFGTAALNIRSDQSQFTGDWVINGGLIQFLTPGAASTGNIYLNGSRMSDRDSVMSLTEVRFNFNSQSPDLFQWQHGRIVSTGFNRIYGIAASDRSIGIGDIDLMGTGTGQEGLVTLRMDGLRSTMHTGTVKLFGHYQLNIESDRNTGAATGVQIGGLDNQGLYDVRKAGWAVLSLGDNSSTLTNATFSIAMGGLRVLHDGALGDDTMNAIVDPTGALEVAVANWNPLATLTQAWGSTERWAVDFARGAGNFVMGGGVHLQIMASQTGSRTISLDGGSLMGYVPIDWDQDAIIHTLGTGITLNLASDSLLGQLQPAGVSSGNNHAYYDMGKLNTTTNLNPNDPGLRGSYLQILGEITGVGGLAKVGQDLVLLAGANTYLGATWIDDGILQIGRTNALPTWTDLTTRFSGMLDLNGFDQEVRSLQGTGGSINNGAFELNTLTVNQSIDTTYRGAINGNVRFVKVGSGTLTLDPVLAESGYRGGTMVEGGTLVIRTDAALGWTRNGFQGDNLTLAGGILRAADDLVLHANRGVLLAAGGGTVEVDDTFTAEVDGGISGEEDLSKTGAGTLQLNSTANTYTGDTHIVDGVLQGGGLNTLAALSRHIVSGTLDLNAFNQTIGSLASAGPAATVALGDETLTVGNDRTRDAIYDGAITGAGIFRVNGNGALQTLAETNHSGQDWSTEIANGTLNVALGGTLGSGAITLGIAGVSGADDYTALNLEGATSLDNDIVVTNENRVGSVSITGSGGVPSSLTGTIDLGRDTFVGATDGSELGLTGNISGLGRLVKVDAGTVRLAGDNTFGPGAPGESSGSSFNGGVLVRAGTVLLEHNAAAGTATIALGDVTSSIGDDVHSATFVSILGSGTWNANGDSVGGQDQGATTGNGAFIGVSTTIDGFNFDTSPLGTRILIAGEEANPERNGIYVIAAINGTTMNLVRADDYKNSDQMKYGAQVTVINGTYEDDTFFMFEEDIVVKNETTLEPIRFREDVVNPNIAVLQNTAGLTIDNHIEINATNGTGTVTLGGSASLTTGTGTFTGDIELQNRDAGGEARTLLLTSSTSDGTGISFDGVISEADSGDTLSIEKIGTGIVTLTAANTYTGNTTVTAGTLQLGSGSDTGSLNPDSDISISAGATFTVNRDDEVVQGIDFSTAVITGEGNFEQAGDGTTILSADNSYKGTTTVSEGVLLINGDQSLATGHVTVEDGGTLGGGGIIGGTGTVTTIEDGGILTAGTVSAGPPDGLNTATLTFNGEVNLESGSVWLVDLVAGSGGPVDMIRVFGELNIHSSATLELILGGVFLEHERYVIADYTGGNWNNVEFQGMADGALVGPGDQYRIRYADNGNFITLTAVPEPGTFGLLGLALVGVLFRRIRKHRADAVASADGAGE